MTSLLHPFGRSVQWVCDLDLRVPYNRGWGDSSISKVLVKQEQRPEFRTQHLDFKKLNVQTCVCNPGAGEAWKEADSRAC